MDPNKEENVCVCERERVCGGVRECVCVCGEREREER